MGARVVGGPAQAVGLGADGEVDPLGVAGAELDHVRAGGGDRDLDLRERRRVREPGEAAREAVDVDRLAAQVGLDRGECLFELVDVGRLAADLAERRVAAPDPEHRPSPALGVERRDGGRGHGRVSGRGVGDARPELEAARGRGGERELDPELGGQVLAVGEQEAVEAPGLGGAGGLDDAAGEREGVEPDLDPGSLSGASVTHAGVRLRLGGLRRVRRAEVEAERGRGAADVEPRPDRLAA